MRPLEPYFTTPSSPWSRLWFWHDLFCSLRFVRPVSRNPSRTSRIHRHGNQNLVLLHPSLPVSKGCLKPSTLSTWVKECLRLSVLKPYYIYIYLLEDSSKFSLHSPKPPPMIISIWCPRSWSRKIHHMSCCMRFLRRKRIALEGLEQSQQHDLLEPSQYTIEKDFGGTSRASTSSGFKPKLLIRLLSSGSYRSNLPSIHGPPKGFVVEAVSHHELRVPRVVCRHGQG